MNLQGKIAVVTGGAMGNGKGIVESLLKYGASVVILDKSSELTNTVNELGSKGHKVLGINVDISNKNLLVQVVDIIKKYYDHIDILVNNAGICKLETFENMTDEMRDLHFNINIKGTWDVTKVLLPMLRSSGKASIINLSSVTGPMVADSGEVAYATTKAGLIGFTKALAREEVDHGIRVNAILPGYIRTPMVDGMAKETNANDPESVINGIAKSIPMKRLGDPSELGELACFLASDASSYITGTSIVIDGGSTLPETVTMGV